MNIVVVGASRGIGFETVRQFASRGNHSIAALSRNTEKLKSLQTQCVEINPAAKVFPITLDVESPQSVNNAVALLQKEFGVLDVFIYNTGALVNKTFSQLQESDFDRMFNVNVKGAFLMIRSLIGMFRKGGHILTISSMGGVQGSAKFPGLSLYSASKGVLAVLTECLAEELKEQGTCCNCLALGAVQTEMLQEAFPGYEAPLQPEEMATFLIDFATTGHRFFNGKILPVSVSTP